MSASELTNTFKYSVLPLRTRNLPLQLDVFAGTGLADTEYGSIGTSSFFRCDRVRDIVLTHSFLLKSAGRSRRSASLDLIQPPAISFSDQSHHSPSRTVKFPHFGTGRDEDASTRHRQADSEEVSHGSNMEVAIYKEPDTTQVGVSVVGTAKEDDTDYSGYKGRGRYAQVAKE